MSEQKIHICKLLDLARQSYQRHLLITEHLGRHFDINYEVFAPDPLLETAIGLLDKHIKDHCLLFWWLQHEDDDNFYADPHRLGGREIYSARQLLEYYEEKVKAGEARNEG